MGKGPRLPIGKKPRVAANSLDSENENTPLQGPAHEIALIESVCAFPPIKQSENLGSLLKFLYRNRSVGLTSEELERHFFKRRDMGDQEAADLPDQQDGTYIKSEHSRERVKKLNGHLQSFARQNPFAEWICRIPKPIGSQGYQLEITPAAWSAAQCVWMDHLRHAADSIVVSGTHLFFFNKEEKMVVRYTDYNEMPPQNDIDGGWKKRFFAELQKKHPGANLRGFEPWANTYLASGDILAFERLSKWFFCQAKVHIERRTTQEITKSDLLGKTPILIGRTQTNSRIKSVLEEPSVKHLRYSIKDPDGIVQIRNMSDREKEALADCCNIGKDGIVTCKDGYVFALLTRARNPHGHGHVTIITCDYYAPAIARIVDVLTDDRWATEILEKANWPKRPYLPSSFQMLFRLRVFEDLMHDQGIPEMLCADLHGLPLAAVS